MGRRLVQMASWSRLDRQDEEGAALGLLTTLLLVLIDLCYHRHTTFAGTFVIAPVLAAGLAQPAIVGGVGAMALGASVGMDHYDGSPTGSLVRYGVVLAGTLLGILTSRHRRVIYERAIRLKSVAEAAESALLRPLPSRVGSASMAGWHVTAATEARVGGDFYEAVPYGTRARWIIGDARGHGVEAIRLGAAVIGAFREAASRLESLDAVAERVEESLAGFLGDEDFVTAIFAELAHDGTLRLINCGHPVPFYLSESDAALSGMAATTPLGLEPDLTGTTMTLSSGASLCFRTDGLDEVRTARGRGVDPGDLSTGLRDRSADQAATLIRERLLCQVSDDRFPDDVSVLVVKYEPLVDVQRPRLRLLSADSPADLQAGAVTPVAESPGS